MNCAMMCPNQAHKYGNFIDDIPPHLDNTGTVIFTIIDGYFSFPLEQYGLTPYIHLRRPSKEKLDHCSIIYITDEENGRPTRHPTIFLRSIQHQHSTWR